MNRLPNLMKYFRRGTAATLLFMGAAQTGLSQVDESPWRSEISVVDPWTNTVDSNLLISEIDAVIYDNYGGVVVRKKEYTAFQQGRKDAMKYHNTFGAECAGFASGVGCFAFPGTLAIPTGLSMVKEHRLENDRNPNNYRLTELYYSEGYARGARQIRSRKAWAGFGIGVGLTGLVSLAVIAAF